MLVADIAHIAGLVAGGRAPVAGGGRRRRHDDDAQDAARSARRHDHVQGRARQGDRPRGVPRPAGRPAQPHDRRHRGRAARRRRPRRSRRTRTRSSRTRRRWRRRSSSAASSLITGGTDNHLILVDLTPQERPGQDRREGARRRGHRAQLQLDPVRSAQAVRSVGRPPRHAGGDEPRHEGARDGADRGVDGSQVVTRARRCGAAREDRRRGARAVREVPGARHPDLTSASGVEGRLARGLRPAGAAASSVAASRRPGRGCGARPRPSVPAGTSITSLASTS